MKVSAWTLPDRVMLCAFNYAKDKAADCVVTLDLRKMGIVLPPGAKAANVEKPDAPVAGDTAKGEVSLTLPVRDYALVSIAGANP